MILNLIWHLKEPGKAKAILKNKRHEGSRYQLSGLTIRADKPVEQYRVHTFCHLTHDRGALQCSGEKSVSSINNVRSTGHAYGRKGIFAFASLFIKISTKRLADLNEEGEMRAYRRKHRRMSLQPCNGQAFLTGHIEHSK